MKNIIITILLAGLVGCSQKAPVFKTGLEGKTLPSFTLLLPDSIRYFNTSSFPKDQPVVLFDFSPWCPYCRAETDDIIANMKSLTGIRFCLLTTAPLSYLRDFYQHYQLQNYPNITIGQDFNDFFGTYFKAQGVPYLAIYTKKNVLKQVIIGKTDIGDIKNIALQ